MRREPTGAIVSLPSRRASIHPLWRTDREKERFITFRIAGGGREILILSSFPTRMEATIWQALVRSKNVSLSVSRYAPVTQTHLDISGLTAPSTGETSDAGFWLAQEETQAALTCEEVLDGCDQRLSVSRSDQISLRLREEHRQRGLFDDQTAFRRCDGCGFSLSPPWARALQLWPPPSAAGGGSSHLRQSQRCTACKHTR